MSVTRSQLRGLRNKVYVRLLSSQSVEKHLMKYQSLTEIFMEEKKTELSLNEIAALESRVQRTEKASVQSHSQTGVGSAGDEILHGLKRLRGQSFGPSILYTTK